MTKTSAPPGGDSTGSSTPPDLSALARKTLDIWQDQMGRLSQDPATLDLMTRTFAMMTKGSEALHDLPKTARDLSALWPQPATAPSAARPDTGETAADAPDAAPAQPGPKTGSASAADVSEHGDHVLTDLLRRIADLEERVSTLESRPAGGDAKPARRRKPG
ncbi:hypothetical protein [Novispirillum itersonii]|uniref:hypothetical protein n=1 Tax=Novispirillum itersonii TaxID=189 RepID=UPI0012DD058F|nr:hypothetical protein [Novispirillum itersonii]